MCLCVFIVCNWSSKTNQFSSFMIWWCKTRVWKSIHYLYFLGPSRKNGEKKDSGDAVVVILYYLFIVGNSKLIKVLKTQSLSWKRETILRIQLCLCEIRKSLLFFFRWSGCPCLFTHIFTNFFIDPIGKQVIYVGTKEFTIAILSQESKSSRGPQVLQLKTGVILEPFFGHKPKVHHPSRGVRSGFHTNDLIRLIILK